MAFVLKAENFNGLKHINRNGCDVIVSNKDSGFRFFVGEQLRFVTKNSESYIVEIIGVPKQLDIGKVWPVIVK